MSTYTRVYSQLYVLNFSKNELPRKLFKKIAFNTRAKIEEHMLIVMDK